MNSTWLDFEKPIVELQRRIDDLENFASEESIEVSHELARLKKKAVRDFYLRPDYIFRRVASTRSLSDLTSQVREGLSLLLKNI